MRRQEIEAALPSTVGRTFRKARLTIGVSQRALARRTGVSQSAQSRFERGLGSSIGLAEIEILARALGGTAMMILDFPFIEQRARQRDALHARCVGYVARRLQSAGWLVATEVQIEGRLGPGWIDLLAFDPGSRTLLVIEVKTAVDDFGQIQRTLGWYTARSFRAAAALGWHPTSRRSALLLLATDAVDRQLLAARELVDVAFADRSRELADLLQHVDRPGSRGSWMLALVDPHHRGRDWLRPARIDGRRRPNPYADYADAWRFLERHREAAR